MKIKNSLGERSGGLTLGLPQTGRQEATVDPLSKVGKQRDHPLTFPLVAAGDVTHHVVHSKHRSRDEEALFAGKTIQLFFF